MATTEAIIRVLHGRNRVKSVSIYVKDEPKDILYNIISTVWHMPLENRKIICYFHARSPDGRDLFTGCILYLGVSGSPPSLAFKE